MLEERLKNKMPLTEKLKIIFICSAGAAFWGLILIGAFQGLMQSF